ncbi:hypothetical protein H1P_1420011 [Hyella patelloides LEGE 07179]|uniref:HTH luxR-type domain-containing protein n=1 Tax=Hyella patelloides LEGE 07179 TaxID=945734 RepID=A0A563VLM7_9CYAN|nr:hypothetical protein H1P_1420011 [Hyella patelloides LEGE 07179]
MPLAFLVAQGLTNADIGKQLWISENTVKKLKKNVYQVRCLYQNRNGF